MKENKKKQAKNQTGKMTRKEAIKKAGATALTVCFLFFLKTKAHASGSVQPTSPNDPTRNPRPG